MTAPTMPNLAGTTTEQLQIISLLSRDYGIPTAEAARIVLRIKQLGFNEGRDAALKSVVEICDGLILGFNSQEVRQ